MIVSFSFSMANYCHCANYKIFSFLQSLPPLLKGTQLIKQLLDLILDTNQDMLRNAMSISSVLNYQAGQDNPELAEQRKKV